MFKKYYLYCLFVNSTASAFLKAELTECPKAPPATQNASQKSSARGQK